MNQTTKIVKHDEDWETDEEAECIKTGFWTSEEVLGPVMSEDSDGDEEETESRDEVEEEPFDWDSWRAEDFKVKKCFIFYYLKNTHFPITNLTFFKIILKTFKLSCLCNHKS